MTDGEWGGLCRGAKLEGNVIGTAKQERGEENN